MDEFLAGQLAGALVLIDIAIAVVLGGAIGIERELKDKPAGLRTHMLVAGSAALVVGLGDLLVHRFADQGLGSFMRADPIRLIEAIVTGVSFLGAGTIIRTRRGDDPVQGLTTAASLLFAAAVGCSVALSQYALAVGACVIVLLTLRAVAVLEDRLF